LRLLNEDLLPQVVGSAVLSDSQKENMTREVESRVKAAVKTWDDFLELAGGQRALVDLRRSYMYKDKTAAVRSHLAALGNQEQQGLLLNWFSTLTGLEVSKPASCLDPALALRDESPCWTLELPVDDLKLDEFDATLDGMLKLADQLTTP
jgi:hypothetical protein